jgi:hypothetical protein
LARAPVDHQHGNLYGAGTETDQGLLAGLTPNIGCRPLPLSVIPGPPRAARPASLGGALRWYAHAPALLRCRPADRYAMRACPMQ